MVNVTGFAQNFRVPFLAYGIVGFSKFLTFEDFIGFFGHLKKYSFSSFEICKIYEVCKETILDDYDYDYDYDYINIQDTR